MKYRKKPVVIDAVQWTGGKLGNLDEVVEFLGRDYRYFKAAEKWTVSIETLEGPITASPGDWIIRGVNGEHYPCKPDIFEKTYEAVTD